MLYYITLLLTKNAMAASCYGTLFPAYIKESGINTGDAEWLSVAINSAQTNLYVGGYSKAVGLFTGVAPGQYPFAANYQLSTDQYLWSKIYFDITGNVQFDAVNIKPDNTVLALAGSTADKMTLFVYLVDPYTGAQLYPYFTVGLDYPATLLNDQSLLFTKGSRLYLTPEFYRGAGAANLNGSWSADAIQTIAVKYTTTGIVKLWHWHSKGGSSANLINLLPNAADGSERVLMGGGASLGANNAFVLALYLISPVNGAISQINLQYGVGGSLFTDETVYHFFARTTILGNLLYAVTRSAKQDARGTSTYYCVFTFTDTTFTTLGTPSKCASQNAGFGYSPTQIVFDMVAFAPTLGALHVIAYDSANQRLLYVRFYLFQNPTLTSFPNGYTTLQIVSGQPYKAAIMAPSKPTVLQTPTPEGGSPLNIKQSYAVGGTSQFLSYASPITNTEKMPYINAIQPASTCTTQNTFTELYVASGYNPLLYSYITVVALQSTFQTVQTFTSNTAPVSTANFKTQNLNFNSISTCSLCRSYQTVTTVAGSFPNQILYQSNINAQLQCSFTPNTATSTACTTPDAWVYTIDESSLGLSYNVFSLNPATNKVQMLLRDSTLAVGVYLITVVGTLPNSQSQSFQFYLSIVAGTTTPTCQTVKTCAQPFEATFAVIPAALTNQAYLISATTLLYVTPSYSLTSLYCAASDIVYSMTVTPTTTGQSVSFITFNQATQTVSVQSATNLDAGTFVVNIYGSVTNLQSTTSNLSSFTLTVTPLTCSLSLDSPTIAADPSFAIGQTLTYTIASATASLQLPACIVTATYCTASDVVYTMTVTPVTVGQSYAFIAFDTSTRTVSVTSTAYTDAGTYTVEILGTLTNQQGPLTSLSSFILIVQTAKTTSCLLSSDRITIATEPSFSAEQSFQYIIGSAVQSIKIPPYLLTASHCSKSDISYYQTITSMPSGLETSQFTFTEATLTTSWYSTNIKHFGNYTVTTEASVTNTLGTQTASTMFQITMVAPANQPPVLLGYTTNYYDISAGQSIQLGPVYDPDQDQTVTVAYQVIPTSKRITYKDGVLTINPNVKVGEYAVTITLTDSFKINPGVTIYSLLLNKTTIVNHPPINVTTEPNNTENTYLTGQHFFSKMTVNQVGLCTVYFSEMLTTPFNYTMLNASQLQIQLLSPFSVDPNLLEFTWNLTEFTPSYMQIQIYFENPLYVSSKSRFELDTLQIIQVDPLKFISLATHTVMANLTNISQSVPKQFVSQYDYTIMSEIVKYTSIILTTVIITTFVLNLYLQKLLQQLWGMVNCLQIIAYMTFFNVFLPANAQLFFELILNTANFNIIPVESIYATLFPFLQASQSDTEQQIFDQVKVLLLSPMQMVLFVPVLIALYYLKRHHNSIARLYYYISHSIFWNGPIRYVMESYMSVTHFTVAFLAVNLSFQTTLTRAWSICVIVALSFYVIVPCAVSIYFRRRFKLFVSNMFKNKFGDIIGNLNWRNVASTNAIALFCYRRLGQVVLIVLLQNYPYAQVQLMAQLQTFVLLIFGYSYVYYLPFDTKMEYFDEFTIMVCIYHYFALTNFVDDPLVRYNVGYSLIATCLLNLAVHLMLVVHSDITVVIRKLKQWRKRIRMIIHRIKQSMKRPKKSILKAPTKYPQDDEPQSPTVQKIQKKTVTFYIESDFISGESSESSNSESSESPNSDSIESSESPREESKSQAPQQLLGQNQTSFNHNKSFKPVLQTRDRVMSQTQKNAQQSAKIARQSKLSIEMQQYQNSPDKINKQAANQRLQNSNKQPEAVPPLIHNQQNKLGVKQQVGQLDVSVVKSWFTSDMEIDFYKMRMESLEKQTRIISDLQKQAQLKPLSDQQQQQLLKAMLLQNSLKPGHCIPYADDDEEEYPK